MPTESALESESITAARAAHHDPYSAWRHRDFNLYAGGYGLALIGQQIQSTALLWEIYERTGRKMDLGWIGLVQALPVMLLALPAGHVADRYDRRKVVMAAQVIAVLCSIALAILSWASVHRGVSYIWMYGPLLLSSAGFTFGRAARHAILPALVPKDVFTNAVTWNSSIFELSSVVGPAAGGLVIAARLGGSESLWFAYVLAVIGQSLYLLFLALIRSRPIAPPRGRVVDDGLASGLRFVWRQKIILATITLDLFAVLLGGATYLLPAIAKEILHVGPVGFGWLRAAPALGAVSMAMLLAHRPPMQRAGRTLLFAVAAFGAATIVFGFSRSFPLSLLMLYLTGAFDNISVVVRHTLVQVLTPDDMRGRVSAVNNVFIGASNELGGLESGFTAQLFGLMPSIVGGGLGTLAVVRWLRWFGRRCGDSGRCIKRARSLLRKRTDERCYSPPLFAGALAAVIPSLIVTAFRIAPTTFASADILIFVPDCCGLNASAITDTASASSPIDAICGRGCRRPLEGRAPVSFRRPALSSSRRSRQARPSGALPRPHRLFRSPLRL